MPAMTFAYRCGWGYAEPGELKEHGAYKVIDSVSELAQTIEDYFA